MKRQIISVGVFFYFCLSYLYADSKNSGLSFITGYRNDCLHWKTNASPISNTSTEEKWKSLQIAEVGGKLEAEYKGFYFRAEGDYGWILAGSKSFDLNEIGVYSDSEWLTAKTRGYVYDVSVNVGYLASFFSNQFQVTPLLGYSYSVQHLKDSDYVDHLFLLNLFDDTTSTYTYSWNGPWFGLCLEYLHRYFRTSLEYQFHVSFYHGTIHDNLIDTEEETQKKNCAYGNEFIARLFSPEWKRWSIGLVGSYQFYNGANGTNTIDGETSNLDGIHWDSGSITLNLKRSF